MAAVVLDACALIAYLRDEQGSERMKEILLRIQDVVFMHVINVGEVFYDGLKRNDPKIEELWQDIADIGIIIRRDMDDEFVAAAARWKAKHRIAYADAFALALANKESASLVTTDHSEFDPINGTGQIKFLWLR